jgi:hypothetical protein
LFLLHVFLAQQTFELLIVSRTLARDGREDEPGLQEENIVDPLKGSCNMELTGLPTDPILGFHKDSKEELLIFEFPNVDDVP